MIWARPPFGLLLAAVDCIDPESLLDSDMQEDLRLKKGQAEPDLRGGIDQLAYLPPLCPLTLEKMAIIFGKSKATVMRAVDDERLPKPFRIFSENLWLVGEILEYFQRFMKEAQERDRPSRPRQKGAAPLAPGTSPIRSRRNARSS